MFRVHEEFPEHEKLEPLESDAVAWANCMALWLAAGCDCRKRLTDGRISRGRVERITPLKEKAIKYADRLVELKLWKRTDDGYEFHDWADVQETKSEVQERRAKDAAKKRKGGSGKGSPGGSGGESPRESPRASPGESPRESPRDGRGDSPLESPGDSERPILVRPSHPSREGERAGAREAHPPGSDPKTGPEGPPAAGTDVTQKWADEWDGSDPDADDEPPGSAEPESEPRTKRLLRAFERIVHGGRKLIPDHATTSALAKLDDTLDGWSDGADPEKFFVAVLEAYARKKREAGKVPELRYFAADFATCAEGVARATPAPRPLHLVELPPPPEGT